MGSLKGRCWNHSPSAKPHAAPNSSHRAALIDTGASITVVEESVLLALGLLATDVAETTVPGGRSLQPVYACNVSFPGTPIPTIPANPVIGIRMAGLRYSALIGRDLLQQCQLIYNGAEGFWTLAF